MGRKLIFVNEFVLLGKNLSFYGQREKNDFPNGEFSKIFFLDHFSPSILDQKL
jgi:hypothetical protein